MNGDGIPYGGGLSMEQRLARLEQRLGVAIPAPPGDGYGLTSDTTQAGGVGWAYPAEYPTIAKLRALGSTVKAATIDPSIINNSGAAISAIDGEVWIQAIYLPFGATLSGVGLISHTAGSFTADNNCKVGLYTRSGSTFTRVAQSANNAAIGTQAAQTYFEVAFSSTYDATPGVYYIATLLNWSAVVTTPAWMGTTGNIAVSHRLGLTLGANLSLTGQTDLPSSSSSFAVSRGNMMFACVV